MPRNLAFNDTPAVGATNQIEVLNYALMTPGIPATGQITIVDWTVTGKTITIGANSYVEGVNFTAVTGNNETATALAAAITGNLPVAVVSAVAVGAVVTITTVSTASGNGIAMSSSDVLFATTDAATAGASDPTQTITVSDRTMDVGVDWVAETSNNVTAANIAAAINGGLPTGIASALAVGAIVTVTATPGTAGNLLEIIDETPIGGIQLLPGPTLFSGGTDLVSDSRVATSGRVALGTGRSLLFNFPNSLTFAAIGNKYGAQTAPADVQTTNRTFEWWTNFDIVPAGTTPIFSLGVANYYMGFNINSYFTSYQDAGSVQRTGSSSAVIHRPHRWFHSAITVETSGLNVTTSYYKNGAFISATTRTDGHATAYGGNMYLGAFSGGALNVNGKIADSRFYSRALTAAEILDRSRNIFVSSGLIHRWSSSIDGGVNIKDSVGTSDFILVGSPYLSTTDVPMRTRGAVT